MKKFAYTIALMLVLVGSAFAQKAQDGNLYAGSSFNELMSGVETSAGTVDLEDNVTWGKTITMRSEAGDFNANLNVEGVEPELQLGNRIVGGTWSLKIFKGGVFQGVMFGEFIGGAVTYKSERDGTITAEYIEGAMTIKGGTGAYANVTPTQISTGKFLSTAYPNSDPTSTEPASHIMIHNGQVDLRY